MTYSGSVQATPGSHAPSAKAAADGRTWSPTGIPLAAALVWCGAMLVQFLIIALVRMPYPYELEWHEGSTLVHVLRVMEGLPVYVEPSVEFTPYMYTPLYYYAAVPFVRLLGEGFPALRLLSFLASLGCLALLFLFARRETGSTAYAFLASCLYAATFRAGGAWLDVGRVDALFMLLLLAALYVSRSCATSRGATLGGLLFALAFFTKQTALLVLLPLLVYHGLFSRRPVGIAFALSALLPMVVVSLGLHARTGGWYTFYVFRLPARHPLVDEMIVGFWLQDMLPRLGVAMGLGAVFLFHLLLRRRWKDLVFYGGAVGAMFFGAWSSRIHAGGYANVLLPAFAGLALLLAPALRVVRFPSGHDGDLPAEDGRLQHPVKAGNRRAAAGAGRRWLPACLVHVGVPLLLMLQFFLLRYPVSDQLPTREDREAGDAFIQLLASFETEPFVPYHSYYPVMAGHRPMGQLMCMSDILRGGEEDDLKAGFRDQVRALLGEGGCDVVVMDLPYLMGEEIPDTFARLGPVFESEAVFYPVTGSRVRPTSLYVRTQSVDYATIRARHPARPREPGVTAQRPGQAE